MFHKNCEVAVGNLWKQNKIAFKKTCFGLNVGLNISEASHTRMRVTAVELELSFQKLSIILLALDI